MTWQELHRSIEERWRPEEVAAAATLLLPELRDLLRPASRYSWGDARFDRYGRPGFRGHSISLGVLASLGLPSDLDAAIGLLEHETGLISDDLRDRMPSPVRRQAGIKISRRAYMRQCRVLLSLRRKRAAVVSRGRFSRWERVAQSGWALDLGLESFMRLTPVTRVFVAYYVARRQRQSVFSGSGQDAAWDRVSDNLFPLITPAPCLGLIFPHKDVLRSMTDAGRTMLLFKGYAELFAMAQVMGALWLSLGADRATMEVQRGMNSSDWNILAGAWNGVRSLWISLIYACGREEDLDRLLPGKAMRLMASDVMAWHRSLGDDEGPDVKVFKQLPLPWDVVLGREVCGRELVLTAISRARVKDTWTKPREPQPPVPTKITNALVHGVAAESPELADMLRRAGWFAGKGVVAKDESALVIRDEFGFAISVEGLSSVIERTAR